MKPILPREMLWTDKKTMDEFFELDRVNEDFFEVFMTLRGEPFAVETDEIKIFNEVYYQITRMIYEKPMPAELPNYISDVKANMGWNFNAEIVMSMAYFLLALINKHVNTLNKFFTKAINDHFSGCQYWKPFKQRYELLKDDKRHIKYSFRPSPIDLSWFKDKYIHWNEITRNYDLVCIEHVIGLWSDVDDMRKVAELINNSISYYTTKRNADDLEFVRHFLEGYLISDNNAPIWKSSDSKMWKESDKLFERIEEAVNMNLALKGRISELETENARLNALLVNKKSNGKARRFTLVEIVDYCKSRVEWDDAKSIVAMLNKLLRKIGTDEDSDLVDSIETEFINRRYGNTFNDANVTFPNAQIDTFNRISGNKSVYLGDE